MIKVAKVNGDEYICYCPFHEDKNASLFINLEKGLAICFAGCYTGDFIGLVAKLFGVNRWKARLISLDEIFSDIKLEKFKSDMLDVDVWKPGNTIDYLAKRGFEDSTINSWGIEYSPIAEAFRIPFKDENQDLLGYVYRILNGDAPKYKNSKHLPKRTFFGVDHYDGTTPILVEGPFDVMWISQCGFNNSLGILGGFTNEDQIEVLKSITDEVILCLDNDYAGQMATKRLEVILDRVQINSYVCKLPEQVKDIQELAEAEVKILLGGPN